MNDLSARPSLQRITLGGGCFWCLEAVFERVRGVLGIESGYCNGTVQNPSYEQVCTGNSGHAEVVRLDFDPEQVSLDELLQVFFLVHDPTSLNRQGADVGSQYRSGIYFHSAEREMQAQRFLAQAQISFARPLVTELMAERNYWPAEAEHQHYFARHSEQGYCAYVVAPKVEKFLASFARLVRP